MMIVEFIFFPNVFSSTRVLLATRISAAVRSFDLKWHESCLQLLLLLRLMRFV